MVTILLCVLGLLTCFYLLSVICDDYFVDSLEKIAHKWKLNEDVAGATLMAIGSSAPELFTALIALTKTGDSIQIGPGTIVGSAIFNVLVIIGVSAVAATAYLSWKPIFRDLAFYILSIVVLLWTFRDGVITRNEALLYLGGYAFYILLLSQWSRWFRDGKQPTEEVSEPEAESPELGGWGLLGLKKLVGLFFPSKDRYVLVFVISILLIGASSWALVELAVVLAHKLGIPEVIIALTILAAGTSVPDMLSSVSVARRGKGDMAVSNAVGSNTFDILIGLGFPWLLYILFTNKNVTVSTENLYSSILLLFFTVISLLFLLILQKFKIGRWSGLFLVVLYAAYLAFAIYTAYHPGELNLEGWVRKFFGRP